MHTTEEVYDALQSVMDPEIPVLSVVDLGMITAVDINSDGILVKMIPTFAACPAVQYIQRNIQTALEEKFSVAITVIIDQETLWSTSRLAPGAKDKLEQFGIAAPQVVDGKAYNEILLQTPCPHCGSKNTYLRSPFGSTLCRAIHYCKDCSNVFEQFKPVE
ncbi:ring-1,2-phenylacetyl-CoA epoxidase subunit PaaD [Chitinophaga skermanii]|uniref:Ring-1,2-phenylacetyl-CoA epoxidase subunit PaaD n=1 Tax=Chitinophaga skermanii TaxID=331697 RepID=A0A327QB16_9BACT|nr:1,2-phenylacetyl-CoA epoxidase subunit PaaD [Chitinophaga skermanii]RAJ01481.1 ring-1,2-phenylacetyl-CoA epoxidase subunit PaaD [Chitinophaga skermanii]